MTDRRRALLILAVAAAVLTGAFAGTSQAQLVDGGPVTSTTTTTTAPSTTTTRSNPEGGPDGTTTTTTAPDDEPGLLDGTGSTTTTTTTAPPKKSPGGGEGPLAPSDGSTPAPDGAGDGEDGEGGPDDATVPRTVPREAQAIINAVQRSAANNSRDLYDAVQELVGLGLTPDEAVRIGFGRFPVGGVANYSHDWLFPRYGPGFRFHLGTDVFAPFGTPLRSPVDGTVESGVGNLGGLYLKVFMDDGTYFYMAHLSALADGFEPGMTVRTGDVIGYVGDSGNAKGGSPHLHIGVYPQGGAAVDPKPILDQMIADAEAALPAIVAQVRNGRDADVAAGRAPTVRTPRSLLATALLRPVVDERAAGGVSTAVLYEAVGNPAAGGLAVAEAEAEAVAAAVDWTSRASMARTRTAFLARAETLFGAALGTFEGRTGDGDLLEAAFGTR